LKPKAIASGHDSLFFKFSGGLCSALIAKGGVLAHNPIGALYLADTYLFQSLGTGEA